jgi:hypothetical protein
MGLFDKLQLEDSPVIDWEMTPEYSFGTFESWGGKERVRSGRERIYYFFVDNWGDRPKVSLMERGIRHARVVADIDVPEELVQRCVDGYGKTPMFERSLAISEELKEWIRSHIVQAEDGSRVIPVVEEDLEESMESGLPGNEEPRPELLLKFLPDQHAEVSEEEVESIIKEYGFLDTQRNPDGDFANYLVDNRDGLTVTDCVTGLMWQRGGLDIMSHRMMKKEIARINTEGFAGHSDWRLPTLPEAMSLLEREKNTKDQYLHPCFSREQPFIFVDAVRNPGGYWFVDFKQGKAFWSSGTIPGGFGRLCRTVR